MWTTSDEAQAEKKYFDGVLASQVRTTSPVNHMTDNEWQALVQMWSDPKHKVRQTSKFPKPDLRYSKIEIKMAS